MKIKERILAKYDVSGIQSYIFASNRLRENMGASYNVGRVLRQLLPEAIRESVALNQGKTVVTEWEKVENGRFLSANNPEIAAEILYIGGGNAVVIYEDEALYNKASRLFAIKTAEQCQGITVVSAGVSTEDDYSKDMARLDQELAVIKRKMKREMPLSPYPIVEQDPSYGIPVTHRFLFNDGSFFDMSTVQYEKYMASNTKVEDDSEGWHYAVQMEELIRERGEDSYVAVVHIDGNGMGEFVNASLSENRAYEKAIPAIRNLSSRIAEVNTAAYKNMVSVLAKASGRNPLPIRPLVMEGDDLTFICGAQYGLPAVEAYLRRLLQMADERFPVSACGGIAFVHSHFPFQIAYQIAEECCGNAKKRWYENCADNREAGYLDFHVVQGAYVRELKDQGEKGRERIRPFRITKKEDLTRPESIDCFNRILERMADGNEEKSWPRSRLKKLYEAYLQGSYAVEFLKREFASRGYEISQLVGCTAEYFDHTKPCGIFDSMEVMDLYDGEIYREFAKAQGKG